MKLKRIIATLIVLSMVLQMFCIFPASAEVGNNLYEYDGYNVEYTVTNEWTGGQNVEIKIINTGEESILNWAVKCDVDGEISGLWNAQIYESNDTTYIFKNCGWNYEIRPNEYVAFGYTLINDTFSVPESFTSCSERGTLTLGYSVDLNITNTWDTGVQGEIAITNTSTEPLEAWILSFDSTFSIDNLWNARVLSSENNSYTIASESWTNPIEVGETLIIGFVGSKTPETSIAIENYSFSTVVINSKLNETEKPEENEVFDKLIISAYGGYIAETDTVDVFWISTVTEGFFEVMTSDVDSEYVVIGSVTDADSYSIPIVLVQNYIKIKQTANGQTAESQPLVVTKNENSYIIDYIDTDKDGLYDYIEEAVGSDKSLSDTDSDGLTDYEEVFLTNTDPVVYNSVDGDLSDAEADCDIDGLSNIEEINLGTSPLNEDTDNDTLVDGDEIGKYGTDPFKSDSDADSISDSDELNVGLKPTNPETFGVPDAEYKFEQTISADSDILSEINTSENPYKVSIDITASGYAQTSLKASQTGYSNVIQNDSMLGVAMELDYTNTHSIENTTLNFEISEEYVYDCYENPEYSGVNRYNIFKYFENVDMLLPIPTDYDVANNVISAEIEELGTYCIMDMVSWFEGMDISVGEYSAQPALMSLADEDLSASTYSLNDVQSNEEVYVSCSEDAVCFSGEIYSEEIDTTVVDDENMLMSTVSIETLSASELDVGTTQIQPDVPIDVIFILQNETANESRFEEQKAGIIDSSDMLFDYFDDVRVHIIYFNYDEAFYFMNGFFTDVVSMAVHMDSIPFIYSESDRFCSQTNAHKILLEEIDFRTYSDKFVFDLLNGYSTTTLQEEVCESQRFNYSELSKYVMTYPDPEDKPYLEGLIHSTGGIIAAYGDELADVIYNHVLNSRRNKDIYYTFNWKKAALNVPLERDGLTDTDDDGITDWNESLNQYLSFDSEDNIVFPTLSEYIYATQNESAIRNMESLMHTPKWRSAPVEAFFGKRVLPICSLPTEEDSDGDGLLDGKHQKDSKGQIIAPIDDNPLKYDGPTGMWEKHINYLQNNNVPNKVEKWYGNMQFSNTLPNIGTEGLAAFVEEFAYLKMNFKVYYTPFQEMCILSLAQKCLVGSILSLPDMGNEVQYNIYLNSAKISFAVMMSIVESTIIDKANKNVIMASLGSRLLNFKADYKNVIHSQQYTWQSIGGYNNIYDKVFKEYTEYNMDNEKFPFYVGDKEYVLWIWRGDYLNLGAGAEMGIYYRPDWMSQDSDDIDHYFADQNFTLPMDLYLYNYENGKVREILAWNPDEPQWWITGFNPGELVNKIDVKKQVLIGNVNFMNTEIYSNFQTEMNLKENKTKKEYLVFDDVHTTVWIMWGLS